MSILRVNRHTEGDIQTLLEDPRWHQLLYLPINSLGVEFGDMFHECSDKNLSKQVKFVPKVHARGINSTLVLNAD